MCKCSVHCWLEALYSVPIIKGIFVMVGFASGLLLFLSYLRDEHPSFPDGWGSTAGFFVGFILLGLSGMCIGIYAGLMNDKEKSKPLMYVAIFLTLHMACEIFLSYFALYFPGPSCCSLGPFGVVLAIAFYFIPMSNLLTLLMMILTGIRVCQIKKDTGQNMTSVEGSPAPERPNSYKVIKRCLYVINIVLIVKGILLDLAISRNFPIYLSRELFLGPAIISISFGILGCIEVKFGNPFVYVLFVLSLMASLALEIGLFTLTIILQFDSSRYLPAIGAIFLGVISITVTLLAFLLHLVFVIKFWKHIPQTLVRSRRADDSPQSGHVTTDGDIDPEGPYLAGAEYHGYEEIAAQVSVVPDGHRYQRLKVRANSPIDKWLKDRGISDAAAQKLKRHDVVTMQGLQDMSHADMVEVGLSVGERNMIKRALEKITTSRF